MFCYRSWTVRTYNKLKVLSARDIYVINDRDCLEVADGIVAGEIGGCGLKMAMELYRAGGLGIYPIYERLGGRMSLEAVCKYCDILDTELHQAVEFMA